MKSVTVNTKIGTLCRCDKYYLYLFPTADEAIITNETEVCNSPVAMDLSRAISWAQYIAERAKCKIIVSDPDECFMIIGRDRNCIKILSGNKTGWLVWSKWLKMYEAYRQ